MSELVALTQRAICIHIKSSTTQTENILGISKNDYYNQYLAYHEGHNGWKNKSYNSKKWLIDVAKNVERKTNMYNNQLKECEDRLNKKGLFGIF